jgi:hypothetical protein
MRKPRVEYCAFKDARRRCNNPKYVGYKDYGARGIKFLFASFSQFLKEIGTRPSDKHSLDRINNDGNYEPGNIKWSTKTEQNQNKRSYFKLHRHGKGYDFSKALGKWRVRIMFFGKRKQYGVFDTEIEAASRYQEKLQELLTEANGKKHTS